MTQTYANRATGTAIPFSELSETGMLWLINRVVFHPRGLALAVHQDAAGKPIGWELVPDPARGPTSFPQGVDAEYFQRAEKTLREALAKLD